MTLLYAVLAAGGAAGALVLTALGPVRDVDIFWHVLLGRELLAGTAVTDAGQGWTLTSTGSTWVSTQWFAERVFAVVDSAWGLRGLVALRVASAAVALAVLAWTTLRRRPLRAAVWPFAIAALMLALATQERAQQVTFALAPLLGVWAVTLVRDGRLPRWWLLLPLVTVWSTIHGGWALVPLVLGVSALARVLDHGIRDRVAWQAIPLAVLTVAAACISPAGIGNVVSVVRISASASQIIEWGHVTPWDVTTLPLVLLLGIAVVVCWRSGERPSRGEVLVVAVLAAYGFWAWRNLTPATLMLAPIAAGILTRALTARDGATPLPHRSAARSWVAGCAATVVTLGLVSAVTLVAHQDPLLSERVPQQLIARLAATTSDQRVITSYNVSGATLLLGGGPPHVRIAIDGRADRYGGGYIRDYQSVLIAAAPGWAPLLDRLAPTSALLREDEPLWTALVTRRGWVDVGHEGMFILLRAPGAPGWSS
jgi:hypothetical protein